MVFKLVKIFVLLLAVTIWSVVGFIAYVPMILRLTAYFSAMVFVASFQNVNLKPIQSKLEYGISFYPNGFARIFKSFSEQELDKHKDVEEEGIDFPKLVGHIRIDIVWGTVFWLGIIPPTLSLIFS